MLLLTKNPVSHHILKVTHNLHPEGLTQGMSTSYNAVANKLVCVLGATLAPPEGARLINVDNALPVLVQN